MAAAVWNDYVEISAASKRPHETLEAWVHLLFVLACATLKMATPVLLRSGRDDLVQKMIDEGSPLDKAHGFRIMVPQDGETVNYL